MIIYNITYKVSHRIEKDWMQWLQQKHIPEIMNTGLFEKNRMFRLLEQDDSEGNTYILQFETTSKENYHQYISHYATAFMEEAFNRWGDQFIAFRTLMQAVN